MHRSFEEFTGRGTTVPSVGPRLTLQQNGKLSLNQAAIAALGNPEAVVLLYEANTRSVGVRGASKLTAHAYPLGPHGASGTRIFSAVAFAKHYAIDMSRTRSFDAVLEDGILVIDLDKGFLSGRGVG